MHSRREFITGASALGLYAGLVGQGRADPALNTPQGRALITGASGSVGPSQRPVMGMLTDGDSTVQGQNGTPPSIPWPTYLANITGQNVLNYGRAGYTLGPGAHSTLADYSTRAGSQYNATTRNTLILCELINDIFADATLAQCISYFQQYSALALASGWQFVASTFPVGGNFTGTNLTTANAVNAWIRANYRQYASYFVDITALPLTFTDGLHPDSAGDQQIAVAVAQALGLPMIPQSNLILPSIQGSVQSGNTLTATTGYWMNYINPTYSYQWNRDGVAISGATSSTYAVQSGDVGHSITVTVTDTSLYAAVSSTSPAAAATGTNLAPTMAATATLASQNGMPDGTILGVVAATNNAYPQPTYTIDNNTIVDVDSGTGAIIYIGALDGSDGNLNEAPITVNITATNSQGSAVSAVSIYRWGKYQYSIVKDGTKAADGVTDYARIMETTLGIGLSRVTNPMTAGQTITLIVEAMQYGTGRAFYNLSARNGAGNHGAGAIYSFAGNNFTTYSSGGWSIASTSAVSLGGGRVRITAVINTVTDTSYVAGVSAWPTANNVGFTQDVTKGGYIANMKVSAV